MGIPEKMRAMVLEAPGRPLEEQEVPVPRPEQGQLLIRIHACGGIHMSDVPSFPYRLLWEERVVRSVANLERRDGEELLALTSESAG